MSDVEYMDDNDLDAFEAAESDDEDVDEDYDEARRRRSRPVTARGRGYTRPRLAEGYVTNAQFQAGVARIGKDIRRNAVGIKALNARIDTALEKQSKSASGMRTELQKTREMSMLMPLLLTPKTITTTGDIVDKTGMTVQIPTGSKVQVTSGDTLSSLLPLLLLGGGLGGDGKNGGDNSMMMLLLVLMMSNK